MIVSPASWGFAPGRRGGLASPDTLFCPPSKFLATSLQITAANYRIMSYDMSKMTSHTAFVNLFEIGNYLLLTMR